ncbi:hypothetical protein K3888_06305 [Dietzia aurantiaca]|uniref:exonuclease domain-containing protein n=1 Tax=Dietzia aurantiaca TaxID=983873 RepID=UPI001E48CEAD|nr:exonuclease domain-containing protein [Dietzia aurantiaca]MCD2262313.1 hypothetical protein [Dietzia aurantiaca]
MVIERNWLIAKVAGARIEIPLREVIGLYVRQPTMLTNGWIQLCVGTVRPELSRTAAPSDPHTVMFKRNQRDQMDSLLQFLHHVIQVNHTQRPPAPAPSPASGPDVATIFEHQPLPAPSPGTTVRHTDRPEPVLSIKVDAFSGPSFVGFDVETANGARGSICAIGLTVVNAGRVTATHSWLCRPPKGLERFDAGNIGIHGITPRDVATQPTFRHRLGDMLDLVGDLPLVAHNAAFDIGALREASAAESMKWRSLQYGCTLRWSRNDLPELPNHRLPTVAQALGVPLHSHHDASADASAAAGIALELMHRRGTPTVDTYVTATGITLGRATVEAIDAPRNTSRTGVPPWVSVRSSATPPAPNPDADPNHPLHGHTAVLTGTLTGLSRDQAWARLAECGARVNKTVTRRTTILVAGYWPDETSYPPSTEKFSEACRLQNAGQGISIINQHQLELLLVGDRSVGLPDLTTPPAVDAYALADDSFIARQNRNDLRKQVRGRHFTAWSEPIKQLKRDNRLDEALTLLLEVINVVERPENCSRGCPAPGWTEQAAIVYRKQKDHASEVAILQRWLDTAHRNGADIDSSHPIKQRITKAKTLLEKQRS